MSNRVVTLDGNVSNLLAKGRAAQVAQTIPGVKWVDNQILVSVPFRSDQRIQDLVEALIVPLLLAAGQTLLVILYFMHLKFGQKLNWVVIGGGFLWLLILVDLTLSDYITRGYVWWLSAAR